jgi:GDP-L-fucose synthase
MDKTCAIEKGNTLMKYSGIVVDRNDGLPPLVNVGVGEDLTIRELAETVKAVTGYQGKIVFDTSKPDGTPRKLLDVTRLKDMGWSTRFNLHDGLKFTYLDFHHQQASQPNQ